MRNWDVLGLMSGSSLDGMDIAHCKFTTDGSGDSFHLVEWTIESGATYAFSDMWKEQLKNASYLSSMDLIDLDRKFGTYTADIVLDFCSRAGIEPDFVALHGHTVFHEPSKGFTLQIGHPGSTAAKTKMITIGDFRSSDVALGGQGAPFAPIVDQYCFPECDMIFNLGGIANVAHLEKGFVAKAFDLCPCNQILNHFSQKLGKNYDNKGEIAQNNSIDFQLSNILNQWSYYNKEPPKSLSNQQVMDDFLGLFPKDILAPIAIATMTKHLAEQIINSINTFTKTTPKVLITGGGAHNLYLLDLIRTGCIKADVLFPDNKLVDFKECLLMALMGLLRLNQQNNVLKVVTGASADHCAGAVYFHKKSIA